MSPNSILFEKKDRIAYLTLNRPKALNGITLEMMQEINQALDDIRQDRSVKALVITGSGRAFCVGLDINVLAGGFDDPVKLREALETTNQMFFNIEALPVPVIAAVNGLAIGGGFEMLLSCDLAVASDDAQIGDNHTHFGVIPGGGATQRAPRKLGMQRALDLIYTARWLTGKDAADWGLVLRSTPPEGLMDAVEEIVAHLRPKSRDSLGFVKKAVMDGAHIPLRDGVSLEIRLFMEYLGTSPDMKEGFTAYREKRKPAFSGE